MTNYNDGPVPIDQLREHFHYDPFTGVLRSRTNRRNVHAGDVVGFSDRQGYVITTLFKRPLKVHRIAWALYHGAWPHSLIDHINGDKSDNRLENLRCVTNAENKQNIEKPASNTSGYMGVSFHKKSGRWAANIKVKGKSQYLGLHDTPYAAHVAYQTAKAEIHPFSHAGAR
ncbi:HNH endonuclease [Paracoccus yeei]|uniref:HNH endonuclease n=1 Tax=Paracoccus yeei TaxID=147645 RepID=UPI001C8D0D18|nr:HNH endonuclease [Paracoccus yeei]MBY0137494.1 HNH endonuclease [Paracoccus yeei]